MTLIQSLRAEKSGFTPIMSAATLPSSSALRVLKRPERSEVRTATPPVPTTPLVGRVSALAELRDLLAQNRTRLLTLTGAGGTGQGEQPRSVLGQQIAQFRQRLSLIHI